MTRRLTPKRSTPKAVAARRAALVASQPRTSQRVLDAWARRTSP